MSDAEESLGVISCKYGHVTKIGTYRSIANATWLNPVASVHVETPYSRIDKMNVLYLALEPAAKVAAMKQRLHPEAEKM